MILIYLFSLLIIYLFVYLVQVQIQIWSISAYKHKLFSLAGVVLPSAVLVHHILDNAALGSRIIHGNANRLQPTPDEAKR